MKAKNFKLITNNLSFGLPPDLSEEVEQHLTVSASGRVWFSVRNYQQYRDNKGFCLKKQLNIGTNHAQYLISLIETISELYQATDVGSCNLIIRYEDGSTREIYGSSIGGVDVVINGKYKVDATRILRKLLPIDNLWGFESGYSTDEEGWMALYEFANYWQRKFLSEQLSDYEFEEFFGNECGNIGFQMDCGKEFINLYPDCFNIPNDRINSVITTIRDVELLGSALYSQWRYLTHWAGRYSLDQDTCHWFSVILGRIKELAESNIEEW